MQISSADCGPVVATNQEHIRAMSEDANAKSGFESKLMALLEPSDLGAQVAGHSSVPNFQKHAVSLTNYTDPRVANLSGPVQPGMTATRPSESTLTFSTRLPTTLDVAKTLLADKQVSIPISKSTVVGARSVKLPSASGSMEVKERSAATSLIFLDTSLLPTQAAIPTTTPTLGLINLPATPEQASQMVSSLSQKSQAPSMAPLSIKNGIGSDGGKKETSALSSEPVGVAKLGANEFIDGIITGKSLDSQAIFTASIQPSLHAPPSIGIKTTGDAATGAAGEITSRTENAPKETHRSVSGGITTFMQPLSGSVAASPPSVKSLLNPVQRGQVKKASPGGSLLVDSTDSQSNNIGAVSQGSAVLQAGDPKPNPLALSGLQSQTSLPRAEASTEKVTNPFAVIDSAAGLPGVQTLTSKHGISVGFRDDTLGWVEIRAQTDAGHMSTILQASSAEAHRALTAELPAMSQFLEEHQVQVHSLTAGQGGQPMNTGQGDRSGAQTQQSPDRNNSTAATQSPRASLIALQSGEGDEYEASRINVRV